MRLQILGASLCLLVSGCWSDYRVGVHEAPAEPTAQPPPLPASLLCPNGEVDCDFLDPPCEGGCAELTEPDSCIGLLPKPLPVPNRITLERTAEEQCGRGDSDAFGYVQLSVKDPRTSTAQVTIYTPAGTPTGSAVNAPMDPIGAFEGFNGVLPVTGGTALASLNHEAVMSLGPVFPADGAYIVGRHPEGVVVWIANPSSRTGGSLHAYDRESRLVWSVPLDEGTFPLAIAVERGAMTLLLFSWKGSPDAPAGLAGQWIDERGLPGEPFPVLARIPELATYMLFERVGQGFFLRESLPGKRASTWVADLPRGERRGRKVPSWLRARPNTQMSMAFNGKAYVVAPNDGEYVSPCQQRVEILTPRGTACAAVVLEAETNACTTGSLSVGYDGSLIQQIPSGSTCAPGAACACGWQYWPAALGRPAPP